MVVRTTYLKFALSILNVRCRWWWLRRVRPSILRRIFFFGGVLCTCIQLTKLFGVHYRLMTVDERMVSTKAKRTNWKSLCTTNEVQRRWCAERKEQAFWNSNERNFVTATFAFSKKIPSNKKRERKKEQKKEMILVVHNVREVKERKEKGWGSWLIGWWIGWLGKLVAVISFVFTFLSGCSPPSSLVF